MSAVSTEVLTALEDCARRDASPDPAHARAILDDPSLPLDRLLTIAALPRERHFGRRVQVHILNNVRNGYCPEDCGYCAQRKDETAAEIPAYAAKSEAEILEEARVAYESGAYRYCLVSAGRGPAEKSAERLADLIRRIKAEYPLQICLSAGIIKNPEIAQTLKAAGLDRYNHNLNTSREHYDAICSTHDYDDRLTTLQLMAGAGVSLCSGVIVGMGESSADLVNVAADLARLGAPSIPVNFFLPVPGHAIEKPSALTPEYCLRALVLFRLMNPRAEIRMAAGRELHIGALQARALEAANSLFVSGYLNVKGSDAAETYAMIEAAGFEVDASDSDFAARRAATRNTAGAMNASELQMKKLEELRPFSG
jgi:biotin synthase